jgi:hypothetical protein
VRWAASRKRGGMIRVKDILKAFIILQTGCLSACVGSLARIVTKTPEMPLLVSCGETVYSREDEEGILENYFEYVSLYDFGTGESLNQDQNGNYLLTEAQYLALGYKSVFPNRMRLCIQEYNNEGKVIFDKLINTDGKGSWPLQPLVTGQYVMRVIVKNMVIDSYILKVSESTISTNWGIPSLVSCGENVYSREDEQGIFEHYFEYFHLQDSATSKNLIEDQNGNYLLNTDQYLAVEYKSTYPGMRICIQEFNEEGKVVFDNSININDQGTWTIRRFSNGRYMMRLIVKITIIKSYVLKVSG